MSNFFGHFITLKPVISSAPAFIGYQNHGGETATHQKSWTTSGQTLAFTLPVPSGSLLVLGCIEGTEIIGTGSIVTTSTMFIAGNTRNINTATPPGTQKGGGIVTLVDPQTVGINGTANINIDTGATLRLGTDWTKKHGWFYSPNGNAQMVNNGILEVRSLSYTDVDQQNGGNSSSTAITRYIGKPDGTTFYNTCLSPNTYGQTFNNLGLVEIDNCVWRPRALSTVNGGTVRVKNGGTLITTLAGNVTQKVFISGKGGNATDFPKAAFVLETNKNFYSSSTIELEADATIAYQGTTYSAGSGYFPPIVSTVDKVLSIGCPTVGGTISSGYGDSAYTPISAANPNLLGGVKVEYGQLRLDIASAIPNAAYVELTGNSNLTVAVANSIKSLRSTSSTTSVTLATALTLTAQESTPIQNNFTGTAAVNVNSGTLIFDRASISSTGAFVIAAGAKIGSTQSISLSGALTMSGATSTLYVSNSTSKIITPTLNATSGFKVDIDPSMVAGTYTILTATGGNKPIPTLGLIPAGLSASFAWSGNNLICTIV